MKLFHRLIEAIFSRTPYIILTPYLNIGNGSEQIYYGLIRARREGKKIIILVPYSLPKIFHFKVANREIYDVISPYRYDPPAYLTVLAQLALTTFYGSMRLIDLALGKLFGPDAHLHWYFISPGLGIAKLFKPEEDPDEFRWDLFDRFDWVKEVHNPLRVELRPEKRAHARALRLEMGLPEDAWFVGLHVREGGFHGDYEEGAFRNASIANYIPAIREITARGGWVVRLGDESMAPLPPMKHVIDYPHTRFKSELMDVYLTSECRFYIGMSTGLLSTALLFQRPLVLANMVNMTLTYPTRVGDRGIPKHLYSKTKGRYLSLQEVFDAPPEAAGYWILGKDFELRENSSQEIQDVVLDFLETLQSGGSALTQLQASVNRLRIEHGRRILCSPLFPNHYDDIDNRYRIAAFLYSSIGSISRSFVEANWERSVLNAKSENTKE